MTPLLPLTLVGTTSVAVEGLLDTGAAINVLPYSLGVQIGANWDQQRTPVQLSGNLVQTEARVLVITAIVAKFPPVRLAFAWANSDHVPLLLGQVNFFLEFNVLLLPLTICI